MTGRDSVTHKSRLSQGVVDQRFNMEKSKQRVFKAIEETAPTRFRQFFKSALMDRFLHTAVLYFVAKFQLQALQTCGKGQHQSMQAGPNDTKQATELEQEMEASFAQLAPLYAHIIMTQSDYEHTQQDKLFFESLYEATNLVLQEAFAGQRFRGAELEQELGSIFRTDKFNIARRRHESPQVTSLMSIREIYRLRHEPDPETGVQSMRALHVTHRRNRGGPASLVSVACSPIINSIIPSPREEFEQRTARRGAKASALAATAGMDADPAARNGFDGAV